MANEKIRYFLWRDGRPRWVPGPKVRNLGFKGRDLKDDAGAWLSYGAAIDAAETLNKAVDARVQGMPAPVLTSANYDRSVAALVDEFLRRPKMQLDDKLAATGKKKLARSTRLAYHAHGKLLKNWVPDFPARAITPAMMEDFYDDRISDSGLTTANAIMRSFKTFFYFGEKKLRWPGMQNPVAGLEMDETEGRLVQWSRPAIDCYVAVADYLGWHSLGDAVIHALLTSQRRNDLLPLKDAAIEGDGIYRFKQSKTGRDAKVKAVPMLLDRVCAMRARKQAQWPGSNAVMQFEIVCEATGAPYPADGSYFGKRFRAMKLIAAGGNGNNSDMDSAMQLLGVTDAQVATMPIARVPELNGLWFRDLRDTAVTWLAAAGCDRYEIATVTGLSIKSVDAILQKHYLVLDDSFAIRAGDKLAAHLGRTA